MFFLILNSILTVFESTAICYSQYVYLTYITSLQYIKNINTLIFNLNHDNDRRGGG